jgi:hypothetical protein
MNGQNPGPDLKQLSMNIKMEDLQPVTCKRCRGEIFQQMVVIRKVSAIISPDGKERFATIPVLVCLSCKELLDPSRVGGIAIEQPEESGGK